MYSCFESIFPITSWIYPKHIVFYSTPSTEGVESKRGNSVCLSVRHHFNISNLGPSNHPRIMLGLTYYTSLDRGWHQRWQWQWQRRTQRQRQRQKYWKDPTCAIFLKRIWLKDIKYDDGGWISDDALGVMRRGWCTGDDAPGVMHRGWCTGCVSRGDAHPGVMRIRGWCTSQLWTINTLFND